MAADLAQNPYGYPYPWPCPWLASHQLYVHRLIEAFNFCLSPQQLPQNMTARQHMDEELWMPIRILAKLPLLDSLFISDIMFPFVTETLHQYGGDTLEVDVAREMVRPKWALRSSVFISSVDVSASTEQVFALLDGIRASVAGYENPFEYGNIHITKQSLSAWTIGFKSPCAGPYAAMALKTKCINGRMILPMACVHLNPPKASYSSAGIAVMEVDALEYGDPVIPPNLVPYYSECPEHLHMLYTTSMMQYAGPGYEGIFQRPEPAADGPSRRPEGADLNQYPDKETQRRKELASDPVSETPAPGTTEPSQEKANPCEEQGSCCSARQEIATDNAHAVKKTKLPETGSDCESSASGDITVRTQNLCTHLPCSCQHQQYADGPDNAKVSPLTQEEVGHESLSQLRGKSDMSSQVQYKAAVNCVANGNGASDSHGEVLSEGSTTRAKVDDLVPRGEADMQRTDKVERATPAQAQWDEDREVGQALLHPSSESLRLPSFLPPINIRKSALQGQELEHDDKAPYTETVIHGCSDTGARDGSFKPRADLSASAIEANEAPVTQQGKASQGANKTESQRSQLRQRGSQQNRKKHHRRVSRSAVEQNGRDDSSTGSNPRRKRNYHRKGRSKDSRNRNSSSQQEASGNDGDRRVHGGSHSSEQRSEWQVITYERRRSWRGNASGGGSGDGGGRSDDRGRHQSPASNSVA